MTFFFFFFIVIDFFCCMIVPARLAMLFAEQSFLCRIFSINKVVVRFVSLLCVGKTTLWNAVTKTVFNKNGGGSNPSYF